MNNREIAQEISNRIGNSPVPFNSVYSIALQIYNELGGDETQFDSVYSILLGILPLTEGIPDDISALQQRVTILEGDVSDLSEEVDTKQDILTAGDNITIDSDNTISSNQIDDSITSASKTWSSQKISQAVDIAGFHVQVVQELPANGDTHTIYFAPSSNPESGNTYDEFIYVNGVWEQIGSTAVDLSGYYTSIETDALLALKQDVIADLEAIRSGATLGATALQSIPSEYVTETELGTALSEKQDVLSAGDNITIEDNVISANDTIENISVLPVASENKDKLFRLDNGEKDVYAAKLLSSETTTTNKLPDEQQIDKAYIYEDLDDGYIYYYKGEVTIVCSDGQVTWYKWYDANQEGCYWITEHNAENITTESLCKWIEESDGWTLNEDSFTNLEFTIANLEDLNTNDCTPIVATYNVPEEYQIGNAYFDGHHKYLYGDYNNIANPIKIVCSDGVIDNCYIWFRDENMTDYIMISNKKASDIYNDGHMTDVTMYDLGEYEAEGWVWNGSKTILTNTDISLDDLFITVGVFHIPQLNAPDSEQVGVAYIDEDSIGGRCLYTGVETTIEVNSNNITVYEWKNEAVDPEYPCYSTKPAYQIYNTDRDSEDVKFYLDEEGSIAEITFANESLSSISTVKYQRTEVTEEWEWGEVINENIINDSSASTTSVYSSNKVDELLEDKANQVDFVIPVDMATQAYDWSVLNTFNTTGFYKGIARADYMGMSLDFAAIQLSVVAASTVIIQTVAMYTFLNGVDNIQMGSRQSTDGGTTWTTMTDSMLPSLNDDASVTTAVANKTTYSRSKIDSLINALSTRIAALEGN